MVLPLPDGTRELLRGRNLKPRDFMRVSVRSREESDNNVYHEAYWSDVDTYRDVPVIDPNTGDIRRYTFFGGGELISIDPIPRTSNLTVQTINMRLSSVVNRVNDLIRYYEPKFAPVTIWRGFLDDNWRMSVPAAVRFVGFINNVKIETPEYGGEGVIECELRGQLFELTRVNPAMRSDEDQRRNRSQTDNFFQDVVTAPHWSGAWGGDTRPPRTEGRKGRRGRD